MVLWNPTLDYKSGTNKLIIPWIKGKVKDSIRQRSLKIKAKEFDFSKELVFQMLRFKPYKALAKITCPTLIIHGDKDEKASYEDSVKYVKLIKGPAKLKTIKGSKHGFHAPKEEKEAIKLTYNFFKENF